MNDSIGAGVTAVTAIIVLAMSVGGVLGGAIGYSMCESRAVKANAAHYVLDENNERQFKWGPKPP